MVDLPLPMNGLGPTTFPWIQADARGRVKQSDRAREQALRMWIQEGPVPRTQSSIELRIDLDGQAFFRWSNIRIPSRQRRGAPSAVAPVAADPTLYLNDHSTESLNLPSVAFGPGTFPDRNTGARGILPASETVHTCHNRCTICPPQREGACRPRQEELAVRVRGVEANPTEVILNVCIALVVLGACWGLQDRQGAVWPHTIVQSLKSPPRSAIEVLARATCWEPTDAPPRTSSLS